jgi:osmoprotectant transport system substrate-binding protein
VRIGAFNFTESKILAQLYAQALEDAGVPASIVDDVPTREIMYPALVQRQLDLVPEYQGTLVRFLSLDSAQVAAPPRQTHEELEAKLPSELEALSFSPGEDKNAIAVTAATARELDLRTVGDLAPVAGDMVFGGPPECPSRPFCLRGLSHTYGITFGEFLALDTGGPLTVAALEGGEIDVGLLFSTDARIDSEGLVVLRDDLRLQPADNVSPVAQRAVLDRYGRNARAAVDRVTSSLTTKTLRRLNGQVDLDALTPERVAAEWLEELGPAR